MDAARFNAEYGVRRKKGQERARGEETGKERRGRGREEGSEVARKKRREKRAGTDVVRVCLWDEVVRTVVEVCLPFPGKFFKVVHRCRCSLAVQKK